MIGNLLVSKFQGLFIGNTNEEAIYFFNAREFYLFIFIHS